MIKTDGELILLWTVPAFVLLWVFAFLYFPGFVEPMSPAMTADEVAAFYRDPDKLPRIRYSMIKFNWFCLGMIPILSLIMMQMRRMAHRTPIFLFSFFGCITGGSTLFLIANIKPNAVVTVSAVLISLFKVRLILQEFMEVRYAPKLLKRLTDAWLLLTGATLIGTYLVGLAGFYQ
jgi:hypothetical protein